MMREQARGASKGRRMAAIAAGILAAICIAFLAYTSVYYHAGGAAGKACMPSSTMPVLETDGEIAFGNPDTAKAGFVLYPGAKVEARAYAPLMRMIAERGYYCVIAKMPFNIAFFHQDAAQGIIDSSPQISSWYVGGHSLGGVAASSWAASNSGEVTGIVFLASYPTSDLSASGLEAMSVYGSEDGVLNRESYAKALASMPPAFDEEVIEGGNHAGFGDYGPQNGDGSSTIGAQAQWAAAAAAIVSFMAR